MNVHCEIALCCAHVQQHPRRHTGAHFHDQLKPQAQVKGLVCGEEEDEEALVSFRFYVKHTDHTQDDVSSFL